MYKMLKKYISVVLAATLCVSAVGCTNSNNNNNSGDASSLGSTTVYTKGVSEIKLSGTFIQSWLCSAWSDERWAEELTMMKGLGMEYIVLGDSATKDTSGSWYSFYPSQLDGLKEGKGSVDTVENALRNCQKFGIKVFVGMGLDENWWDKFIYDSDWFNESNTKYTEIAQELYDLYKKDYGDTFYGWYWVPEIWNADVFNHSSSSRDASITVLANGLDIVLDYLTQLSPEMPMMLSPFANTDLGSADDNYLFWRDLIKEANFREGDILCPMDSVGAGGTKIEYLDKWFEAYSKAVAETGKVEFWANCEDFGYTMNKEACSANWDRFLQQMTIASKYCKKTITFAYAHYYSPYNTIDGFNKTYEDYLKNGKLETEKPSTPENLTVKFENKVAILDWDASTDNMGVSQYNIYRNGKMIENICVGRSDNAVAVPQLDTSTTDWDAKDLFSTDGMITYSVTAVDCAGNESDKAESILKQS